MGFFASFGAGLANGIVKQDDDEKKQQDDLAKIGLERVLKNVDSYNTGKAKYNSDMNSSQFWSNSSKMEDGTPAVSQAQAYGLVSNGYSGKDMESAIAEARRNYKKPAPNPAQGNVAAQTQSAMPGLGSSISPQQPNITPISGASPVATGMQPTLTDRLTGTNPNDAVNKRVGALAGASTGMTPAELAQASGGHFQAPIPTVGFPFSMQDKEAYKDIDPSKFKTDALYNQAMDLVGKGDIVGARRLMMTRADIDASDIAKARASRDDDTPDLKNARAIVKSGEINPTTGKVWTVGEILAHKEKLGDSTVGATSFPDIDANLMGNDFLTALAVKHPQVARLAPAIVSGAMPAPSWYSLTRAGSGMGPAAEEAAFRLDPTFSAATFPVRQKVYMEWANPGSKTSVANFSAVKFVNHIGEFVDAAKAFGNSDITPADDVVNWAKKVKSDPKYSTLDTTITTAGNEYNTMLVSTSGTEKERDHAMALLGNNKGVRGQLAAAVEMVGLAMGRIDPMAKNYSDAYQTEPNIFTPQAKASYDKIYNSAVEYNNTHPKDKIPINIPKEMPYYHPGASVFNVHGDTAQGNTQQGQATPIAPPPQAIEDLKLNPGTRAHFDEAFGPGSAAKVLGN